MNEKELIRRFNDDVNKIQARQATSEVDISDDYAGMIKIASYLSNFSSAPLSKTHLLLRQGLLKKIENMTQRVLGRPRLSFVTILGIFGLLALFSLAIPPVRTFAQDILQGIGNFFFVNQPSDAENYVATMQSGTPTLTPDPAIVAKITPQFFETKLLTVAEASKKAGYPVYSFDYIPGGYTLSTRDVLFTGQTITSDTSYRMELDPPLNEGLQFAAIIALEQTLTNDNTDPWITGISKSKVVEVTVREVEGVWIEQIPIYPFQNENGEWDYARWNQLIWSEDGFTFVLQTNLPTEMLPLEEMLKIVTSLKP